MPPATSPAVHRLLRRCLIKNPKDRLGDIGTARLDIDDDAAPTELASASGTATGPGPRWLTVIGGFVIGAMVTGLTLWVWGSASESPSTMRLTIQLPGNVVWTGGQGTGLVLSPGANHVVFTAASTESPRQQLFLRALAGGSSHASSEFFVQAIWDRDGTSASLILNYGGPP